MPFTLEHLTADGPHAASWRSGVRRLRTSSHTVCRASTAVFSLGPAVNPEVLENSSVPADLGSRGLPLEKPSFSSGRASYLSRVPNQALQSKLCG